MFRFAENKQRLYPNEKAQIYLGSQYLDIFYFIGCVVGRAFFDNIIINPIFSLFFLRLIVGKSNSLV